MGAQGLAAWKKRAFFLGGMSNEHIFWKRALSLAKPLEHMFVYQRVLQVLIIIFIGIYMHSYAFIKPL